MYNKIFTKILDSSIWLEPDATRIVWLTCIAAMDEDGFCAFAAPANLARRANVDPKKCAAALSTLESPDPNSSDPEHDGRRLERVPGGWVVLNAAKYRELVTREFSRENTRIRVKRHRDKRNTQTVTETLQTVTSNASEAYTDAVSGSEADAEETRKPAASSAALPMRIGQGRPLPEYRRLRIFRWMLEDIIGMLGDSAVAFDLDAFLLQLDSSGDVLPAQIWPWLKELVAGEAGRRGMVPSSPQPIVATNKRIAGLQKGGEAFLRMAAERKAREIGQ